MANQDNIQKMHAATSLSKTLEDNCLILETSYMQQIIDSASDESELREHIYHRLRVLKDLKVVLTKVIANGQISQADVIRMSKIQSGEIKEFF